jgi:hypothetical protein
MDDISTLLLTIFEAKQQTTKLLKLVTEKEVNRTGK